MPEFIIDDETQVLMQEISAGLDEILNGDLKGADRQNGFVLMTFPFFNQGTIVNYVSNVENRSAVIEALRIMIVHLSDERDRPGNTPIN